MALAQLKVEVDDDNLRECETEKERKELIESIVQEEFNTNINWFITDYGLDDFQEDKNE